MNSEIEDPAVITIFQSESGDLTVMWDQATGGVKVSDGEWMMPSTWKGDQNE